MNLIPNKLDDQCLWAQAAIELIARRRRGELAGRLPETLRPRDVDAGWQIQQQVSRCLGSRVAGWKCALPGEGKLVVAAIYENAVYETHHAVLLAHRTMQHEARFEPEIAYVLAHDLPPQALAYTPDEIDAAVLHARCALEVIGSRYNNDAEIPFAEQLADGLFHTGLVLGPVVDDCNWQDFELTVEVAGAVAKYVACHPDGHPRAGLYWLANFLSARGTGLQAGQAVITGSLAGVLTLPAGKTITFRYGNLAHSEFEFGYINQENVHQAHVDKEAS